MFRSLMARLVAGQRCKRAPCRTQMGATSDSPSSAKKRLLVRHVLKRVCDEGDRVPQAGGFVRRPSHVGGTQEEWQQEDDGDDGRIWANDLDESG
jgi:hypothetical protein